MMLCFVLPLCLVDALLGLFLLVILFLLLYLVVDRAVVSCGPHPPGLGATSLAAMGQLFNAADFKVLLFSLVLILNFR